MFLHSVRVDKSLNPNWRSRSPTQRNYGLSFEGGGNKGDLTEKKGARGLERVTLC